MMAVTNWRNLQVNCDWLMGDLHRLKALLNDSCNIAAILKFRLHDTITLLNQFQVNYKIKSEQNTGNRRTHLRYGIVS